MPDQKFEVNKTPVSEVLWQKCKELVDFGEVVIIDVELHLFVRHRLGSPYLFCMEDGVTWLMTEAVINGFRVSGPNRVCKALGIE